MGQASLLGSIDESVGKWLGVSKTSVLIFFTVGGIVLALAILSAEDAKKRKRAAEDDPLGGRSGHLAAPVIVDRTRLSQICDEGAHDRCLTKVQTANGISDCSCTCHLGAQTNFCANARHDLCPASVTLPSGATRPCGCTCHKRSS